MQAPQSDGRWMVQMHLLPGLSLALPDLTDERVRGLRITPRLMAFVFDDASEMGSGRDTLSWADCIPWKPSTPHIPGNLERRSGKGRKTPWKR